jgi:hypothetical protein
MAAGVFAIVTLMPNEDLLAWGWRIPFLLSAVLASCVLVRYRLPRTSCQTTLPSPPKPFHPDVLRRVLAHTQMRL